ncbi:hypothetical protein ES288_1Z002500v1 [Gossypium darwinii]|uniref:Zinc finger PHD-type domain-containing protein n=1 Tax=Gossypium darwinii TaxID=34276 RepID=A0A5C7J022_GOSDA|nr:hypothetical protein ES288_1Z002500v1 [Gossypium darwinii]
MSQKVRAKAESGTCNVCSAPCSSCMHLSIAQMGSKSDEFPDETDHVAVGSQYSINEDKTGDSLYHRPSEASNLLSVNSSHDSYSESIESKATARPSDVANAMVDAGIDRTFSNKSDGSKASDANITFSYSNKDLDSKNSSRSATSVCSLGSGKAPTSEKLELSEPASVKEGSSSPRIQTPYSHSGSSKSAVGGSSEISPKIHPKLEADIDDNGRDPLDETGKNLKEDEIDELNEFVKLPDKQESPSQTASVDESYESDASEHDVKVCDICGDAGREDLLAICSKCTDGAEHTYCMREMLQKVPEGDWLCEECKLGEETESQKQGLDAEGKKANKLSSSTRSLGKRHAENLEGASAPKRQAIQTNMGSPKSLSPSRLSAFSREGSFKNLDKGKVRPSPQISLGNHSGNGMPEAVRTPTSGPRLQTSKGSLLKCSSFNTLNSKPKLKLVDEVVIQKRKVKTLSSKYPHVQDLKGLKQVDQKLTPRADAISHSSANHRETKVVPSEGRPNTLSRSTSNLARKGVDNAVSSAVSFTNGRNSSEQKVNPVSLKEEPSSSSSRASERQPSNNNGCVRWPISVSRFINQSEKSRESSVSRSSKRVPCLTCKGMGHTAEYCSVCQASGADQSAPRTSREEINKGNKLKAAIEAAVRLKPGICERTSQDPSSVCDKAKNVISVESTDEGKANICNQASTANIKLLNSHSTDAVSVVSSGNLSVGDNYLSAIPEHEYVWQGAFDVNKLGKPPELCGGIQAHISTLASPKVLEVVNSFPHKVSLYEVPRLSTWPAQFHDSSPKEDNIALYFFAKDLERKFEGVELLIFPSNHLPEHCQRWNNLFFLWGVFKARKANCSNSSKSVCNPDASMVCLEKQRSMGNVVPVTTSVEKTCISTDRVGDTKVASFEQTFGGIKEKLEEQDVKVDTKFLSRIATSSTHVQPKMKCTTTLEMHIEEAKPSLNNCLLEKQEAVVEEKIGGDPVKIRYSKDDVCADGKTSIRDLNSLQLNHPKTPFLDLTKPVPEVSIDTSQKLPWAEVKRVSVDRGCDNKKLKTGFSGIYKKIIPEDMGSSERFFFPVESRGPGEFRLGDNSKPWKELSLKDEDREQWKKNDNRNTPQDKVTKKQEEDDVSASLSLSLSFPFPEMERNVKPVPKPEQQLPERHPVNTSLLLFRGFPEK